MWAVFLYALLGSLGLCAIAVQDRTVDPFPLITITLFSMLTYIMTYRGLPHMYPYLIKAGLFGHDRNKVGRPQVPESGGMVSGTVYLVTLFLFLPFPFIRTLVADANPINTTDAGEIFASSLAGIDLVEMLVALLSISCMLFLGFADDVLVLRWREKLILPFIAILPVLMVYYIDYGVTHILLPKPLSSLVRYLRIVEYNNVLDVGIFYYIYMLMLGVFCTNAINIYAGVNGLEAGQSVVIGITLIINAVIMLSKGHQKEASIVFFLTMPFVGAAYGLLRRNWWPSSVFVGDTFCYFAGMLFGVVGILSHTSKTLLLFFIPQWINFLYSVPQLFKVINCPRHRMPRLNPATGLIEASRTDPFKRQSLNAVGTATLFVFECLRLVDVKPEKENMISINNLTLINLVLVKGGPVREDHLAQRLLIMQCVCSVLAFAIRYRFAGLIYDVVE